MWTSSVKKYGKVAHLWMVIMGFVLSLLKRIASLLFHFIVALEKKDINSNFFYISH